MNTAQKITSKNHTSTQNPCKLCSPLGASLVIKGIRGAVPLLHGSQGCSTYIRRYLISHFKEPIDIASSNFGEDTAIFGGGMNLKIALENIIAQYQPELIGVATTCLSETIGDDVNMFIHKFLKQRDGQTTPPIVHMPTPSYSGTHMTGFHRGALEIVKALVTEQAGKRSHSVNIFPGMLSAEDLRYLKEILADFGLIPMMLPDYSQTMDGTPWAEYQKIPAGGTSVNQIRDASSAAASLQMGRVLNAEAESAGKYLRKTFGIPCHELGLPIGIKETDRLFAALQEITGKEMPQKYIEERGRLVDAYIDGHKYVNGVKAALYGEEDLVVGLASFLSEIGIVPVICASGGESGNLAVKLSDVMDKNIIEKCKILEGMDFKSIESEVAACPPDIFIGNSKGYSITRRIDIPLVRVGFPVHDRIGGQRILHVGYRGAQALFDRIANTVIEQRQDGSGIGYMYM
ncbi:MAG: nitrogenase [Desulfobacteraceae bacterium]|nr:MAG: nitrogenase [Desulfobacteraceae bacterium]